MGHANEVNYETREWGKSCSVCGTRRVTLVIIGHDLLQRKTFLNLN